VRTVNSQKANEENYAVGLTIGLVSGLAIGLVIGFAVILVFRKKRKLSET
jgi:F0F1-type ATP synthase assembly protein I